MLSSPEIEFPEGLVGCPDWRHFRVEQRPDIQPVVLLHVIEQPELTFMAADPRLWFADYDCDIKPADREALRAGPDDPLAILAVLTVEAQPFRVTANLLGPLVINLASGLGRQVVQSSRPYLASQPIGLETRTLTFADGWVGCPEWQHFVLHESSQTYPVKLLVSQDQPRLSLPVVDPSLVDMDYAPRLAEGDRLALGLEPDEKADWLCVLNVRNDPFEVTANLLGPLAFNPRTRVARQVILTQSNYSARQPVGGQLLHSLEEVDYARADAPAR